MAHDECFYSVTKRVIVACLMLGLFLFLLPVANGALVHAQSADEYIISTLKYGIDEKVIETVNKLISDKNYKFDNELYTVLLQTGNTKIKEGIIRYFASKDPVDEKIWTLVEAFITGRDKEAKEVVNASFNYLIKLKKCNIAGDIEKILANNEKEFFVPAVRLAGAAMLVNLSPKLVSLYDSSEIPQESKYEILLALGNLKYPDAINLYRKIIERDEASGKVERMYACAALGKLQGEEAISVLAKAFGQKDPNVRGAAVQALAEIGTTNTLSYLILALRDSHVIPRLAAVEASGKLKLEDAIPYLEYQFRQDPEKKVKEAAIAALGKIGTAQCKSIMETNIANDKIPDNYRVLLFFVLTESMGTEVTKDSPALAFFIKTMNNKDRTVFNDLVRRITASPSLNFVPYITMLLEDKEFTIRLSALSWIERNKVILFLEKVKSLSESDPVENVRKKALAVLAVLQSK